MTGFTYGTGFTYTEVGATAYDELPAGYHHQRRRVQVGQGAAAFRAAADGLMTFEMHRRAGLRPKVSAPHADVDVTVVNRLGPLAAPCRVVWAEEGERRAGFGYGTLPGHPECGEEAFVVSLDEGGTVWFEIVAFSKPNTWYARFGGPAGRALQAWVTRRYIEAMRALIKVTAG